MTAVAEVGVSTDGINDVDVGARSIWELIPILIAAVESIVIIGRAATTVGGKRAYLLFDDAAISLAYARNFADGHGLVWFAGQHPVEGYSNFLWTMIMTGVELGHPSDQMAGFSDHDCRCHTSHRKRLPHHADYRMVRPRQYTNNGCDRRDHGHVLWSELLDPRRHGIRLSLPCCLRGQFSAPFGPPVKQIEARRRMRFSSALEVFSLLIFSRGRCAHPRSRRPRVDLDSTGKPMEIHLHCRNSHLIGAGRAPCIPTGVLRISIPKHLLPQGVWHTHDDACRLGIHSRTASRIHGLS